mgnify:CR=1 FL=1|tara:strand:- start:1033 stop:1617 length:585 start_codon:yes stop_codon:yes gene_type:complete
MSNWEDPFSSSDKEQDFLNSYGITKRQADGIDRIVDQAYIHLQKEFYDARVDAENEGRKFNGKINKRKPSQIFQTRMTRALGDLLAKKKISKGEIDYFLNEWLYKASHQQKMVDLSMGLYNPDSRPSTPTSTASDSDSEDRHPQLKSSTNRLSLSPARKKVRSAKPSQDDENTMPVPITTGFDIEKFKFLTISN